MNQLDDRWAVWALLVVMPCPARAADTGEPAALVSTCGAQSLFMLMRLEGQAIDVAEMASHLPSPTTRGHSLRDLQAAARAFGLNLVGVRIDDPSDLDRPAIVAYKDGSNGHFMVVRPVGHTSKLLQVLDSRRRAPVVIDAGALRHDPAWRGVALVPSRGHRPRWIAGSITGVLVRRPRAA